MIYSKRDGREKPSMDDFEGVEQKRKIEVFDKSQFSAPVLQGRAKRKIKFRARKIKRARHGGAKRAALFAACFLLCAMIFDNRILGGVIGRAALSGFSGGLKRSDIGRDITLYSRLSFTKEPISEMQEDNYEVTEKQEQAFAAGASVSTLNLDGESFYPITANDLSANDVRVLANETSYKPDMNKLAEAIPAVLSDTEVSGEPLVLILHTHGTECYTDYTQNYPKGEQTRSSDKSKNIIRVGKEIADTLNLYGVPAIHCEIMHDENSFINAYNESAKTVRKYLAEYPSIRFVIDVHRDAIIKSDGEGIKAVEVIGGKEYAQLMFVVGTDERGHEHGAWRENLSLAAHLQKSIEDTYPGLCRSINLRDVPFNQWLSEGYLLLEVGTCSNTLEEALRSARAFGENLARSILIGGR